MPIEGLGSVNSSSQQSSASSRQASGAIAKTSNQEPKSYDSQGRSLARWQQKQPPVLTDDRAKAISDNFVNFYSGNGFGPNGKNFQHYINALSSNEYILMFEQLINDLFPVLNHPQIPLNLHTVNVFKENEQLRENQLNALTALLNLAGIEFKDNSFRLKANFSALDSLFFRAIGKERIAQAIESLNLLGNAKLAGELKSFLVKIGLENGLTRAQLHSIEKIQINPFEEKTPQVPLKFSTPTLAKKDKTPLFKEYDEYLINTFEHEDSLPIFRKTTTVTMPKPAVLNVERERLLSILRKVPMADNPKNLANLLDALILLDIREENDPHLSKSDCDRTLNDQKLETNTIASFFNFLKSSDKDNVFLFNTREISYDEKDIVGDNYLVEKIKDNWVITDQHDHKICIFNQKGSINPEIKKKFFSQLTENNMDFYLTNISKHDIFHQLERYLLLCEHHSSTEAYEDILIKKPTTQSHKNLTEKKIYIFDQDKYLIQDRNDVIPPDLKPFNKRVNDPNNYKKNPVYAGMGLACVDQSLDFIEYWYGMDRVSGNSESFKFRGALSVASELTFAKKYNLIAPLQYKNSESVLFPSMKGRFAITTEEDGLANLKTLFDHLDKTVPFFVMSNILERFNYGIGHAVALFYHNEQWNIFSNLDTPCMGPVYQNGKLSTMGRRWLMEGFQYIAMDTSRTKFLRHYVNYSRKNDPENAYFALIRDNQWGIKNCQLSQKEKILPRLTSIAPVALSSIKKTAKIQSKIDEKKVIIDKQSSSVISENSIDQILSSFSPSRISVQNQEQCLYDPFEVLLLAGQITPFTYNKIGTVGLDDRFSASDETPIRLDSLFSNFKEKSTYLIAVGDKKQHVQYYTLVCKNKTWQMKSADGKISNLYVNNTQNQLVLNPKIASLMMKNAVNIIEINQTRVQLFQNFYDEVKNKGIKIARKQLLETNPIKSAYIDLFYDNQREVIKPFLYKYHAEQQLISAENRKSITKRKDLLNYKGDEFYKQHYVSDGDQCICFLEYFHNIKSVELSNTDLKQLDFSFPLSINNYLTFGSCIVDPLNQQNEQRFHSFPSDMVDNKRKKEIKSLLNYLDPILPYAVTSTTHPEEKNKNHSFVLFHHDKDWYIFSCVSNPQIQKATINGELTDLGFQILSDKFTYSAVDKSRTLFLRDMWSYVRRYGEDVMFKDIMFKLPIENKHFSDYRTKK